MWWWSVRKSLKGASSEDRGDSGGAMTTGTMWPTRYSSKSFEDMFPYLAALQWTSSKPTKDCVGRS